MGVTDEVLLKSLKTQLTKNEEQLKIIDAEWMRVCSEHATNQRNIINKINEIKSKIAAMTAPDKPIIITEHAILRYFERVLEYNIDDIKNKILTEKMIENYKTLGNGSYPIDGTKQQFNGNCWSAVIKNNTVITIE